MLYNIVCVFLSLTEMIGNALSKSFGKGGKSPSITEVHLKFFTPKYPHSTEGNLMSTLCFLIHS